MSDPHESKTFRYDLALSLAGKNLDYVREVDLELCAKLGAERVFFYERYQHLVPGRDADTFLQNLYAQDTAMVVPFIDEAYGKSEWCMTEWRAIRVLDKRLTIATDSTARLRIFPVRFDKTKIPGALDDTIYCDAPGLSPAQMATLILQRLAELRNNGRTFEKPPPGEALVPPGDSRSATAASGRNWVWHSSLSSRGAGKVSVLACVETLAAVALYWWIAIHYDTHWHLVSSVFIAPLLLLRSPESIAAGVRWFVKDWFDCQNYKQWSRIRKACWGTTLLLASVIATALWARWLGPHFGLHLERKSSFGLEMAFYALLIMFPFAFSSMIASATLGTNPPADVGSIAVVSAFVVMGLIALIVSATLVGSGVYTLYTYFIVYLWLFVIGTAVFVASAGLFGAFFGAGITMRALVIRFAATLRHLLTGTLRIPENWRESNFVVDSLLPAELIPGIRGHDESCTFDGLLGNVASERELLHKWLTFPLMGAAFFIPAFFYRLGIKATAWFWWPLAYLLNPAPVVDTEGRQKQALCWPWTNPFQKLWIIVSVLLMLISATLHNLNLADWVVVKDLPALPLALKVSLAIDWEHLAPWHWAQWIIAGTGAGMLMLAGNARSHDVNGNWGDYRQRWPRNIRLMTGLRRVRTLATVALLLMALGALLLQDSAWQTQLSVPESWIKALKQFYRIQK